MNSPGEDGSHLTSIHIQQAVQGDLESLGWVVRRFTPVLLAQAAYRIDTGLRHLYDPEDLVHDVWTTALPKLSDLPVQEKGFTRLLVKFLSTILLYRFNNLVRKQITGKPRREPDSRPDSSGGRPSRTTRRRTGSE